MKINITPDPNFERLHKTLLLEGKADRVPLFDFNIDDTIKESIIERKLITPEDEVEFWVKAGYDYVQIRLKPKHTIASVNIEKDGNKSVSSSHGNIGSLEQLNSGEYEWTPVYKNTWELKDYNLDFLQGIYKALPKGMKLIAHAADIYTRSWMSMGFEDFCYALYEDPELIEELFRQNAIMEVRMLESLVENFVDKIGAIFYSDDLAYTEGLMLSKDVYRKYLWPHFRKIAKIAKELNVPIIYHTDGQLWEVFDDFAEMGVNGIQPLEPKSMDLVELKQKRGSQFCLMGSVDVDVLSRGTPEEVDAMVKDRIETLGYNGGYTVGTSNTVPYYVNHENYKTMIEAAFKYGKKEG